MSVCDIFSQDFCTSKASKAVSWATEKIVHTVYIDMPVSDADEKCLEAVQKLEEIGAQRKEEEKKKKMAIGIGSGTGTIFIGMAAIG